MVLRVYVLNHFRKRSFVERVSKDVIVTIATNFSFSKSGTSINFFTLRSPFLVFRSFRVENKTTVCTPETGRHNSLKPSKMNISLSTRTRSLTDGYLRIHGLITWTGTPYPREDGSLIQQSRVFCHTIMKRTWRFGDNGIFDTVLTNYPKTRGNPKVPIKGSKKSKFRPHLND